MTTTVVIKKTLHACEDKDMLQLNPKTEALSQNIDRS